MVKSEIIKKLKQKNPQFTHLQLESLIDIILNTIIEKIANNKPVEIRSLGRFMVKTIKEKYNARNPKTNETIYVPEKKKISFKMSKNLQQEINE
ncbi:integration host factor subunit beta [Pelagibacteraceae bacterium]|nr:integration host factor subunit beta [Pelagibacteraceae bacterium]